MTEQKDNPENFRFPTVHGEVLPDYRTVFPKTLAKKSIETLEAVYCKTDENVCIANVCAFF
jgi:hypothetical protein